MRSNSCLTILHISIMALLTGTLEADSADSDCEVFLKVRRHTVNEAAFGHNLTINCTVAFCASSKPAVSWFKDRANGSFVPVNVNSSSHITTAWTDLSPGEGISYLTFKKVVINDSGLYQCQSGNGVSHSINVSVKGDGEFTTVKWEQTTNIKQPTTQPGSPAPQITFSPCVYRIVMVVVFFVMVTVICVASTLRWKGVCRAGEHRNAPDLSCQPSRGSSRTRHIYENDPSVP